MTVPRDDLRASVDTPLMCAACGIGGVVSPLFFFFFPLLLEESKLISEGGGGGF